MIARIYNSNTGEQMDRDSTSHKTHTADKPHVYHKWFRCLGQLTKHKYVHNGIKRFNCDICNKAFARKQDMTRHKRIHNDGRPFTCDVCFSAFSELITLREHKRIHSVARPFTCDICYKTFTRSSSLNSHKLIHSSERLYIRRFTCNICNKAFLYRHHLTKHKRIHSGEGPYICVVSMVHNCLHQKTPQYLTDCCIPISDVASRRHLRSASRRHLVPRHNLSTYGRRAFAVAGPAAWNSLSDDLRDLALSTDSFRRALKTRLFSEY